MRNLITICFFIIFCGIITTIVNAKQPSPIHAGMQVNSHLVFDKKFSGKAYAIDGDSLKVGNNEVRLYMLDAPEYSQHCFNVKNEEYECGKKSHEFLTNLASGKNVECVYAQKDKYDRFLSKCSVGDVSINKEIVKNGMAVIYSFGEHDENMEKLESEAKRKRLGVWQGAFQLPSEYRKTHKRI
jgi:endonuclease YncB( thermonuclease family)